MRYTFLAVASALFLSVGRADESRQRLEGVDSISQNAIQSAFRVLRKDYIRPDELTLDQLNRATLQGMLERLDFGASLVKELSTDAAKAKPRVKSEMLTARIAYLKPMTVVQEEVAEMEAALNDFQTKGASHVILDLRGAAAPSELEATSSMAELFLPRGELLFKLRRLGGSDARLYLATREPVWKGSLVVLIDSDSTNVAETLAAVLKQKKRGVLVGTRTRGATVRYEELPLDSGWRLRFASAEVLLADDESVFKKGVEPHFNVSHSADEKHATLLAVDSQLVKTLVFERARLRFNEKALVTGTNPELDDYVARSTGRQMYYDLPPVRDSVLQRAVDLVSNLDLAK
ncbi:MAG: hypothetical protein JNJ83_06735 [Verrucomicrobiaceae bacterium]|nr:hypothetical protein [Verrucomicrobiaceae bacterium]